MAVHMRNGIQYGGIPNGTVKGTTPSTVPTTVKQLNQIGTVGDIAPVTIPSAVKFSNGNTLETAIGSVATIETSPTVATHEVGEFIFYNGQMYRVIATIAVGETLTVDTNIEATSVGAELTSLNNGLTSLENNPVIIWKSSTRSNISHSTGANYWTMNDTFPAKAGYTRKIFGVSISDTTGSVVPIGTYFSGDTPVIRTRNVGNATVTIGITATYVYLKDSAQF